MNVGPSDYELRALKEIQGWKGREDPWYGKALRYAGKPMDAISSLASRAPGFDWAIQKTVGRLVTLLNDAAQWSVRKRAICAEYGALGFRVERLEDVLDLDLESVDNAIGRLEAKYVAMAAAEGTAAGAAGVFGIPTDVVGLTALSLRAIGEYATYCGFDVSNPEEKLYAVNLLDFALSPDERAKRDSLSRLLKVARDVAAKRVQRETRESVLEKVIESAARSMGVRLTSEKYAQFLPLAGALVAGGSNAFHAAAVCRASYYLYRERFLARKYGDYVIGLLSDPMKDLAKGGVESEKGD